MKKDVLLKIPEYPLVDVIGGRPYINLSLLATIGRVFGMDPRKMLERSQDLWGRVPDEIDSAGTAPLFAGITGFAGSAGVVERYVRYIDSPENGDQLQPGEILATATTNVGWTPLFPRAAAVVTDVGVPLSHAASVARELGIPAVVGCGNGTMCLHTGDRVRVNDGQGIVEILKGNGE